jgi:hypothetical protein
VPSINENIRSQKKQEEKKKKTELLKNGINGRALTKKK